MLFSPKSLFGRFVLIILIPVIIIQLITAAIFYRRHWGNVNRGMQEALVSEIALLVDLTENVEDEQILKKIIDSWKTVFAAQITHIAPVKRVTRKYYEERYKFKKLSEYLQLSLKREVWLYYMPEKQMIGCDIPLKKFNLHVEFSGLRVHSSTAHIFIYWVIGTSLLLALIAILFMRKQVKSILDLTNAANKFGSGRKFIDFKPGGAIEIRSAGFALLKMKKRLERNIHNRSELLTHISHDLRTPITRMKLRLATCDDSKSVAALSKNLYEMEELLSKYLNFAKGEGNEEHIMIDVCEIIRERIVNFEDSRIHYSGVVSCRISIRINAIKRAIDNVLSNACKFANNTILVRTKIENKGILIDIEDDGIGINEGLHKKVLEPFFRMNENKSGFGLGLAIVKSIIQGHAGFLKLSHSDDLGGLKVCIFLPM